MNDWQGFSPLNDFTGPLLDNLKRHPKRIVFPEGEDVRVLRVSQRFVEEQAARLSCWGGGKSSREWRK